MKQFYYKLNHTEINLEKDVTKEVRLSELSAALQSQYGVLFSQLVGLLNSYCNKKKLE